MKILWVKAGKLLPVNTGGRIRSYHILRQLARHHEVILLTYYGGEPDPAYEEEIQRHLPGAVAVNIVAPDATVAQRSFHYLRNLASPAPFAVANFTDAKVKRMIEDWFRARRFDVAVCDFLAASLNFPRDLSTPTVLFQHNVETELWRRRAEVESNWLTRLAYKLEAAKMAHYERSVVGRFHHTVVVSDHDANAMKLMTEASKITVVPTGVDLEQFRTATNYQADGPLVIFTGSMDWEPNIDGVEYFCSEIWPLVRAKIPGAKFRVVGRDPHARVRRLASDSIEVTGTVPSVIDHMKEAAVFVVPLRAGGGTRIKIFEAMAVGNAIVSTSVGAEGLAVQNGRDILLADDAASFAECIVRFLNDPALRERFGKAAAQLVLQYDWSVITKHFEQALTRTIDSGRQATGLRSAAVS